MDFGDDKCSGFIAPTDGAQQQLQVSRAELDSKFIERVVYFLAEDVVIFKQLATEFVTKSGGRFD